MTRARSWLRGKGLILAFGGIACTCAAISTISAMHLPTATVPMARLGTDASCRDYPGLPPGWGQERHAGMVQLGGGEFTLGALDGYPEERPARKARVDGFWMDRTEVTNAQFASFVAATGYVTEAEQTGTGVVFRVLDSTGDRSGRKGQWWHEVKGANWRHPEGPGSSIEGKQSHPVVQVSRRDAEVYATWLGRRLPTEAEWEYAAKANGAAERIARGPRDSQGKPAGNFWQGPFPFVDVAEDGHAGRAAVGCFAANGFQLHDMIGNVWEWSSEHWSGNHQFHGTGMASAKSRPISSAPGLIKGGSFLCSAEFCVRYRSSARHPQDPRMGAVHVGFRTVTL